MRRAKIAIEYCVECMYLPRALELAQTLLQAYADQIEELTLQPGHEGVFDVYCDDEKIFAMEGVLPHPEAIARRVREALSGRALA